MPGLPTCSKCGRPRVFDPCRDCATPAQLAATHRTASGTEVPNYPPLPKEN